MDLTGKSISERGYLPDMGYIKIHCAECRRRWAVYARDDWKADAARTCPHCGAQIDPQTWEKQVLPAFGMMGDANRELFKDHTGYHAPLFRVDYIASKERN